MSTIITQLFISITIVTILVLLWRARHEHLSGIGNSWSYILTGFACLASGEIANFVFRILVRQGQVPANMTQSFIAFGHIVIVIGLLFTTFGVYRWLSAARELSVESAVVKKRNVDLYERVSRDGMLLSTVPAALYRTSGFFEAESSEIAFLNDKIQDLLGYSLADFQADPTLFASLMHDSDKEPFEASRNELWHKDDIVIEHRFRHKNGEYRWLRRHLKRVSENSNELTEWHGCIFDITDLKEAEARLTNFLEAAPDPVITTNGKGEIVLVNAQAERLFAYSKVELLGQHVQILIPEDVRDRHFRTLSAYLSETTTLTIDIGAELSGLRKDGTVFPAEISVSPIETANEKLFAFAVRDVSARKDIEAQLRQSQKMEAVGQLTGGIAHDFNNMLTVVIGNLQLLEQRMADDAETRSLTDAAIDASMRAAELIRRLLAFSRRQLLAPRPTKINELVVGLEPLLRRTITDHVSLKISLADDLWLACIDRSQLENTLMNLANNARDAVSLGGRLTIETHNTVLDETYAAQEGDVRPGQYTLIVVSDNGKGIPKDVLPHVFEPFYSTKEVGKGTGLGLSMVYGFVKQSNGHVKIYSEEGHGTTIKMYLPRAKTADEVPVEQPISPKAMPGGNETILLVEDDDGVREIAITLLTSLGYKVLPANCGSDALMLLAQNEHVDLLFTDIVMPGGMTGTKLAKLALASNKNLKVLYTSGFTDTTVFDNGLLERNHDVLNKPYRKEQLAQDVRDVLDRE